MQKRNVLLQICLTLGVAAWLSFQGYAQAAAGDQSAVGAFDPVSTRILSDPLFLPLKGQIYGQTAYTFSDWRGDGFNAVSGARNYYYRDFQDTMAQDFAYGISDDLTVGIAESYTWEHDQDMLGNTSLASSTKSTSNPTFKATYRVLDQSVYPVDADVSAGYTPNFDINGGYVASGLQNATLTASIGREMKALTVQLIGTADYFGVLKNLQLNEREGDTWLYDLALNTQVRLTNRFSVDGGVDYYFPNIQKFAGGYGYEKEVWGNYIAINTALNYQIIPNKLVGSITYSYVPTYSVKEKYSDPLLNNENLNGLYGNVAGVRLQYLF